MRNPLPPLSSVRSFEAVARQLSFSRAAEELPVTPGAPLAGAKHVRANCGAKFSLAELAMQAAIDGLGVVLGRVVLAEGDLSARRLVRPFALTLPLDVSYILVWSKAVPPRPEMLSFRNWLFSSLQARDLRSPASPNA